MMKNVRLPTKRQIELYKLIHPDFDGLSVKEAAAHLNINCRTVYALIDRMKHDFPYAFRFEKVWTRIQRNMSKRPLVNLTNINLIYRNYKVFAKRKQIPFELSLDEFYEVITLPCMVCEKEGYKEGLTKDGKLFKYGKLICQDFDTGFTYLNTFSICNSCLKNKSWKNLQKFKRLGF